MQQIAKRDKANKDIKLLKGHWEEVVDQPKRMI